MRIRKGIATGLCAVAIALSSMGLQADTPKSGGTLIMTLGATPRHLNPAVQSGITTGAQSPIMTSTSC